MWKALNSLALVACPLLPGAPLAAEEDQPAPGTVFTYAITNTEVNGLSSGAGTATKTIHEAAAGTLAVSDCNGPQSCLLTVQRDFLKTVTWANASAEAVAAMGVEDWTAEETAIRITISEESGGAFFPLEDGKLLRWTEDWTSEHFNARYRMQAQQICCDAADHPLAQSDRLWTIRYGFERVDEEALGSGDVLFTYDPVLKWYLVSETINRTQDDVDAPVRTRIFRSDLKSVRDADAVGSPASGQN